MTDGLGQFLLRFCELHERERRGGLPPEERAFYRRCREEVAEFLVLGQRLEMRPGDAARRAVRVARALHVEFELEGGKASCLTRDLSVGGLAALVDEAPPVGAVVPFRLKLGRDVEPVVGVSRVVHVSDQGGSAKIAVMFEGLEEAAQDRIQTIVFDAVCASLRVAFKTA